MKIVKPSAKIDGRVDGREILEHIERCGRTAYKSEGKIRKGTKWVRGPVVEHFDGTAPDFVRKIIKRGHESVLEHASVSARIICDRGVSHELVRHRLAAFTQESTRYCDYRGGNIAFVKPPDLLPESPAEECWYRTMEASEAAYLKLRNHGLSPQTARSVLPNALKTELVVTANLREWRHIFRLRCDKAAHPQMREIMLPLLAEFAEKIPVVFDDFPRTGGEK